MPHAARLIEPAAAEAEPSEPSLPGVPRFHGGRRASGNSNIPQPSTEVSGVHALPHGNPRVEHQQVLLPAIEGAKMRDSTRTSRQEFLKLNVLRCIGLAALLVCSVG